MPQVNHMGHWPPPKKSHFLDSFAYALQELGRDEGQ